MLPGQHTLGTFLALDASRGRQDSADGDAAPPFKRPRVAPHSCAACGKSYSKKRALARHKHTGLHRRSAGLEPLEGYICAYEYCKKSFSRNHDRRRHEEEAHKGRRRTNVPDQSKIYVAEPEVSRLSDGNANMLGSESPGDNRLPARRNEDKQSQSWFKENSDSEEDAENFDSMEPRPDTQLSLKTTKSSAVDSAIDMPDDQPHEPKRPSITTFDYRSDRSDESTHAPKYRIFSYAREGDTAPRSTVDSAETQIEVSQSPTLPLRPKTTIIQKGGKTTTLSVHNTICVFCDSPFPSDESSLMSHLLAHLDRLRGETPNICELCNIGFVHKADLEKHQRSADILSHCGFHFDHQRPCTGHHPPAEVDSEVAFSDRDSFRLCEQLRGWEIWQLRVYMEEIKQLVAKHNGETSTCYSLEALMKRPRDSMSSFAISVNTYGSAPCDRAAGGQLDVGGLRHRMKMLSLKSSTTQVRHTAKKLPHILRSGGGLGKALYSAAASGDQSQV